jgi:hypothetical protein
LLKLTGRSGGEVKRGGRNAGVAGMGGLDVITSGAGDAVGPVASGTRDAIGATGASSCVATMSKSRRIWLSLAIDACSFNGQLRLLIMWPCL